MSDLAIKYRPDTLDDVYGNEGTVEMLRSFIERPTRQCVLFHGPSGCGKTTLARIVARGIGVHERDFRELNTADFRGIDMARDLIRQSRLRPIAGDKRAWLLDECHMLTKDAQNALLKVLEDAPPDVYFFLATTEPNKLLPTITGRSVTYKVDTLDEEEVAALLAKVAKAEDRRVPLQVLKTIAQAVEGSPRAALVNLGKIIHMSPNAMRKVAVDTFVTEQADTLELYRALTRTHKWAKVRKVLARLQGNVESETLRRGVLGLATAEALRTDDPPIIVAIVLEKFKPHTYDSAFPGVVQASWDTILEYNAAMND